MLIINKVKDINLSMIAILFLAFTVRYWGINFGLPHTECRPDETLIIHRVLGFFSGDLNPHWFVYPSLYMYILFGVYVFYFVIGKFWGRYSSPSDLIQAYVVDPTIFHLLDRFISVFLGTATVFIVYKIVETLFDKKTATISSLFLSLAYLHVRDSHFGVTDVSMTFLVMLCLLFIIRSYKKKNFKNYVISGLIGGLAVSTKYNSLVLVIPMAVVHLMNTLDERLKNQKCGNNEIEYKTIQFHKILQYLFAILGIVLLILGIVFTPDIAEHYLTPDDGKIDDPSIIQLFRLILLFSGIGLSLLAITMHKIKLVSDFLDKRILIFTATFIGAFLLGTPFALLDGKTFMTYFFSVLVQQQRGYGWNPGIIGWWYHARFTFPLGLGWALFLASLVGSIILVKTAFQKAAILWSFPLIYYLLAGKGYGVHLRYMVVMIPFACIAAAIFITYISNKIVKYFELYSFKKPLILFLATLIIFQSADKVIKLDSLLVKQDNRIIAANWINNNIQENSSIYQTGSIYSNLQLYPSKESLESLEEKYKKMVAIKAIGTSQLLKAQMQYITNEEIKGYNEWEYDQENNKFKFNTKEINELPKYIVTPKYAFISPSHKVPDGITETLGNYYFLVQKFEAINIDNTKNWFDIMDAFYLPFSGFKDVKRPGPNIYIYQRNYS